MPQPFAGHGELIVVEPSLLTVGDYLDGDLIGELMILTDRKVGDFDGIFPDDSVSCGAGSGIFVNDRSLNSKGLTRNYTRTIGVTAASQFQNWTSVQNGNMSCVPTVAGAAIDYWNRTLKGFDRNTTSLFGIIDRLHRMKGANIQNGTSDDGFLFGITTWIKKSGYAKNMTITKRGAGSGFMNGVNVTGIPGTGDLFNPLTIEMIIDEFFTKKEFTILIIEVPGGFHAVAVHSMSNTANSNGAYDVALMDPATGEIIETEIEPNGDICTEWNADGTCKASTTLQQIWSISMID